MLGLSVASYAQKGNGKVTGKIIDASNNETIIGASIKVAGTTMGTSSIADGSYVLSLPAGTYTLSYKYIGYQGKEVSGVVVKAGESTFQNIILKSSSQQLDAVVVKVTAKKEGQSSVYSAQKRSAAASDGISQDVIRRTPDNNAAQILTRVTGINVQDNKFVVVRGLGDQYNQTMVNGVQMTSTQTDRNAFAFDLIPAAVIDNIVVNKTATPDMPGNFAGGVVQVNTKDFPDNTFLSISLQSGFSDKTIGKNFYSSERGKLDWIALGGKFRNLPADFPVVGSRSSLYTINQQERFRQLQSLPNNLVPLNFGASGPNSAVQVGYGRSFNLKNGDKFGVIAALNQRKNEIIEEETTARQPILSVAGERRPGSTSTELEPFSKILGLGSYSQNTRYNYSSNFGAVLNLAYRFGGNKITFKNIYTTVFNNRFVDRPDLIITFISVLAPESPIAKSLSFFTEQSGFFNSTLGGEHRTGKNNETRIDWNVNTTVNNINAPDAKNFVFRRDTITGLYRSNSDFSDLGEGLATFSRSWFKNKDRIYGAAFNVTSSINIVQIKSLFKAGVLFQNRHRDAFGTIIPIATHGYTTIDSVLSAGRLTPFNTEDYPGLALTAESSSVYEAATSLLATYESLENKIGKQWRIIWGLRLENYQQNVNPGKKNYDEFFKEPTIEYVATASRATLNLLPSVNLIYSPSDKINIRGALSNTVIRPDMRDLLTQGRYDFQTLVNTEGNRNLKSASVTNYDLKLEWFPSAGEIISAGAFYKTIKNPIEYAEATQERLSVRRAINTGNAYVKGLEIEVRKKLDFFKFAPWLSHVSLSGNGTLLRSKVKRIQFLPNEIPEFFSEHPLTGQANYIINSGINLSLFKNTFDASISYNKTGDYVNSLGSSDLDLTAENGVKFPRNPHFMLKSRELVDLVISQAVLKRKGQLRFKASNLLNKPYVIYQDLNANGKFDMPVTVTAVNNPFGNYSAGTDNTVTYIKPQRTFSLSFAYTF